MRIFQLVVVIIILCLSNIVLAQHYNIVVIGQVIDTNWMSQREVGILKSMKLTYKKPAILDEVKGMECFEDNPQLNEILSCAKHQLHSKDGQFIAFIQIDNPITEADTLLWKKLMPGRSYDFIDKQHIAQMKKDLRVSLLKEGSLSWRQYVTYYSSNDAKSKFNADTATFLPITFISPKFYYKGKYNNLEALYLQKKGRGIVNFYWFYTDEAKKDLPLYRKAIEEIFRYED